MSISITDVRVLQNDFTTCNGECGASVEHVMQYGRFDLIRIELPRHAPLGVNDHHLLSAGFRSDGRRSYIFWSRGYDGLWYTGDGPSADELYFIKRSSDAALRFSVSRSSDIVCMCALRYDADAYVRCEYYRRKQEQEEVGMDPTGPFSWKFNRYLPSTSQTSLLSFI